MLPRESLPVGFGVPARARGGFERFGPSHKGRVAVPRGTQEKELSLSLREEGDKEVCRRTAGPASTE